MTTILTNEDKAGIINQHKRNLEINKFNLELSLAEENSITSPNAELVSTFTGQIADLAKKIAVLDTELAEVLS
jgi:hypothetical protein